MKRLLTVIVSTILLASCTMRIDSDEETKPSQGQDSVAVNFGLYMNRSTATKAGLTGELTTDRLKEDGGGFGVFAYYGNGALYNETSKPDFMYNQKVEYKTVGTTSVWTYEPVKYWPNEFGTEASSEAADRLTFFAYAPHVAVTPSTGLVTGEGTSGIIGMSRNIATGDPLVMYEANLTPGSGVDLCWGVAADDFTSSVDGNNNNVVKGQPFINVIKPKTGDRIAFDFHHSLAQLNVQVDADIDVESHATSSLATGTHIYVRSVTFTGFALRGSLNLNSNTTSGPAWFDISGTGRVKRDPVTIHDGRTDGLEAMAEDVNEVPAGLNPMIIQNGTSEGVTNTAANLFNSTEQEAPIMVIPTSGVPVKVTIVYDIETADPRLSGYLSDGTTHGISVENTITKTIQLTGGGNLTLEAGKKYVVGLHLGLTSVKLDATVADWDNTSYANTNLPINTSSVGSVSLSSTTATVWRNGSVTKPTVTAVTASDGMDLTGLATIAWSSSNASVATVDANTGDITLTGSGSTDIVATATYDGSSQTGVFKLYVNEVTAVAITADPTSAKAAPGGTITLTATLTHTSNGTIATWPTVSWVSGSTDYFSVSPASSTATHAGNATTATTTSSAIAVGSSTITATVGAEFASSTVSNTKDLTCENAAPTAPTGTSGGLFSVSTTKKVYIATSNLMWEGTTESGVYKLMDNPWTTIETNGDAFSMPANYGISASTSVQVSLFGWGTPSTPYLTSDDDDDYAVGGFVDWGTMYGDGNWRCLTNDEWYYLLTRPVGSFGKGFALGTVNDIHGLIIIPDGFTTPSGLSFTAGLSEGFDTNEYTISEWATLQSAGVVFLPAAGYRSPNSERVQKVGDILAYYSKSVASSVDALYYEESFGLRTTASSDGDDNYPSDGYSVRLVYDAN